MSAVGVVLHRIGSDIVARVDRGWHREKSGESRSRWLTRWSTYINILLSLDGLTWLGDAGDRDGRLMSLRLGLGPGCSSMYPECRVRKRSLVVSLGQRGASRSTDQNVDDRTTVSKEVNKQSTSSDQNIQRDLRGVDRWIIPRDCPTRIVPRHRDDDGKDSFRSDAASRNIVKHQTLINASLIRRISRGSAVFASASTI